MRTQRNHGLENLEPRLLASRVLPGDANHDSTVDIADTAIVAANWQRPTQRGDFGGDFNSDGFVDINDLGILASHWQQSVQAPSYNFRSEVINGVVHAWVPNPTDIGPELWNNPSPTALYGIDGWPDLSSVVQGQIADCWLHVGTGAYADSRPKVLMDAIKWDGFGWSVEFVYPTRTVVHIQDQFSVSLQANTGELWAYIVEKAAAYFRTRNPSTNTFASLDWGNPNEVFRWFSGVLNTQSMFFSEQAVVDLVDINRPVGFITPSVTTSLVASHAYVVASYRRDTQGVLFLTLYNPWGFYQELRYSEIVPQTYFSLQYVN